MKYNLTLVILLSVTLLSKEVSVFDAGNINSDKPYGLTNSEKASYNNKQKIKSLKKKLESLSYKINNLKSSHTDLNQKIQGIASVYENDSVNLNKTKRNLTNISSSIETTNTTLENVKQLTMNNTNSIILLEKRLDEFINLQNLNNTNIKSLLDSINKNYVSKKQFQELVSFVNGNKKTFNFNKKKSHEKNLKLTNKQKLSKAIIMFEKRYLTKSIPLWNELLKDNYMPAKVNYYIGEVRYGKKQYKKAIHHYKTSMMLFDEAKYIPNLLLHSAMSFEKIKDKENALNFYNTLIDVYSASKEAKLAKKQLKNFK